MEIQKDRLTCVVPGCHTLLDLFRLSISARFVPPCILFPQPVVVLVVVVVV